MNYMYLYNGNVFKSPFYSVPVKRTVNRDYILPQSHSLKSFQVLCRVFLAVFICINPKRIKMFSKDFFIVASY